MWTAPELLRDEHYCTKRGGTQPADVYSFAIIVQEVLVRGEPYCMLTLSAEGKQKKEFDLYQKLCSFIASCQAEAFHIKNVLTSVKHVFFSHAFFLLN